MTDIVIAANSRAEWSPLASVIAALPEARIVTYVANSEPHEDMADALHHFHRQLAGARIVILLGDRYETLAAALAATFLRIPIAHIHGGETTTGAFDDAFRHSIAHLAEQSGGVHLAATEKAAHRITEMTGGSQRVHLVGAPGLDGIPENSARRERAIAVVGFHPETQAADYGVSLCQEMLRVLRKQSPSERIVFTGVNKDPGHEQIEELIEGFCQSRPATRVIAPLPRDAYISLLQEAKLCVGNSSSFVIESPWIGIPSVIIGNRQRGREMAPSTFQDDENLEQAFNEAVTWERAPGESAIYRGGNVGARIAEIVREFVRVTR